ncbi:hypothetical protein [Compostibacter hankyongensis]|uniref:hypothetical protein n=1 Tax=Compostibacter hankyongensis TaxID=1007089 RepID=UPI0031E9A976
MLPFLRSEIRFVPSETTGLTVWDCFPAFSLTGLVFTPFCGCVFCFSAGLGFITVFFSTAFFFSATFFSIVFRAGFTAVFGFAATVDGRTGFRDLASTEAFFFTAAGLAAVFLVFDAFAFEGTAAFFTVLRGSLLGMAFFLAAVLGAAVFCAAFFTVFTAAFFTTFFAAF